MSKGGLKMASPPDTRPERVVVFTMALPPGGGKSTLFHGLQDALRRGAVSYCFRSSDDYKGRQPFENEFVRCVEGRPAQRGAKLSPKGEPGPANELVVVGYDKNIPNLDGLKRLLRVLQPLAGRFRLRLLAVVPDQLNHDTFWRRVKLRDSNTHIGLTIGPKLSEEEAYKIFRTFFFDACVEFQSAAARAPCSTVTGAFVRPPKAGGSNPLSQLTGELRDQLLANALGTPLEEVVKWVKMY